MAGESFINMSFMIVYFSTNNNNIAVSVSSLYLLMLLFPCTPFLLPCVHDTACTMPLLLVLGNRDCDVFGWVTQLDAVIVLFMWWILKRETKRGKVCECPKCEWAKDWGTIARWPASSAPALAVVPRRKCR